MRQWYAVHTQAMAERKAVFHLTNQKFETYLPCYSKQRRHARRVDWISAPLFPRYIFVNFDIETVHWRAISSTVGVSYIISQGDKPVPVSEKLINAFRDREGEDGLVQMNDFAAFNKGDEVRFISGPLTDQLGFFECQRDNDRVVILMKLLGRPMHVTTGIEVIAAS
jgi:transcriptional antiterminator RfaH